MKSLRLERWASQLQHAPRNPRLRCVQTCSYSSASAVRVPRRELQARYQHLQTQWQNQRRGETTRRKASTSAAAEQVQQEEALYEPFRADGQAGAVGAGVGSEYESRAELNFPSHRKAIKSAKLAALHARLSLPAKFPLQTLARCLIDPSVDPRSGYNNAPLAILGQELLGYHTTEWLVCKYPRLPMSIIMAAAYGYVGNATLNSIRLEWGVEAVAAPGPEVDAGLLQLKRMTPGNAMAEDGMRRVKDVEQEESGKRYPHKSLSGRIVYNDMFGGTNEFPAFDTKPYPGAPSSTSVASGAAASEPEAEGGEEASFESVPVEEPTNEDLDTQPVTLEDASAGFVRALAGALYLHAGSSAVRDFHNAHILSRHLPLHNMFNFTRPTQDLSKLCNLQGWEPPVARLISETGRLSRTPVFVVGVFSGDDKLGEGVGASLNEGRTRAAANALRSWYLYSPMESQICFPSEVEGSQAGKKKKWIPQYVDPGEIVA
ncbi:54S ribosomal protein L3, mitochondrial [Cercospora beticola]|uniref:Large ribosomal subunit protein mL44 n=1 Tax=Cercospora beticola TaxID=122368 RepID=A0A2G5I4M9_CERBT|nr:54S ribosomal protein L3, mitochondrial [Cercospora beticola]PIA99756.1 54S ribosomal protein L3, mitochondrial [Cercospora beticola]